MLLSQNYTQQNLCPAHSWVLLPWAWGYCGADAPLPKFHDIFPDQRVSPRLGAALSLSSLCLSRDYPQTQSLVSVKSVELCNSWAVVQQPREHFTSYCTNLGSKQPGKRMTRATANAHMQEATRERKTGWAGQSPCTVVREKELGLCSRRRG